MSKGTFFLKPVDDGLPADTKCIDLPDGKTTIGRGLFLGCSEKKVSRNHAVLEVTADGELFITPTHVNPCFYHEKGVLDPLVVLAKGDPQKLDPGDQFSLLPESCRYEVGIVKSLENGDVAKACRTEERSDVQKAIGNSSICRDNNMHFNEALTPVEHDSSTTEDEALKKKDPDCPAAMKTDGPPQDDLSEGEASCRTLPGWMVEADGGDSAAEKPVSKRKTSKPQQVSKKKTSEPQQQGVEKIKKEDYSAFFPLSSEDDEDDGPSSPIPKKREKKKPQIAAKHDLSDDDTTEDPKPEDGSTSPKPKKHPANIAKHDLSDEDATEEPKSAAGGRKTATASKRKDPAADDGLEIKKRKPCEFGKKCYRKNPSHHTECSHPGDEDYTSDVEEDNEDKSDGSEKDDRPECEFGTDCYRKNPKHRKEYKHTKRPPRRAAREAKRKTATRDEDSEEDSLESSFIDDSNDDSSYSPDDEDLKTLKKEAREFTSNKKLYEMKS